MNETEKALWTLSTQLRRGQLITLALATPEKKPGAYEARPWIERLKEAKAMFDDATRVLEGSL